jgi:hypothetical protein
MRLTENISTTTSLAALDRNATACRQTDWRAMEIGMSAGAKEHDPFRELRSFVKDSGAAKSDRLHTKLDLLLAERGDFTPASRSKLHTALDQMIARAAAHDDEEQEPYEDDPDDGEAEIVSNDHDLRRLNSAIADFGDAVERSNARSSAGSSGAGRTYAADANTALVNRHLRPDMTIKQAMTSLTRLYPGNNADKIAQAAWNGLSHFMSGFPQDATKVKELPPSMLGPLLRHLEKNHAEYGIRALDPRPA